MVQRMEKYKCCKDHSLKAIQNLVGLVFAHMGVLHKILYQIQLPLASVHWVSKKARQEFATFDAQSMWDRLSIKMCCSPLNLDGQQLCQKRNSLVQIFINWQFPVVYQRLIPIWSTSRIQRLMPLYCQMCSFCWSGTIDDIITTW